MTTVQLNLLPDVKLLYIKAQRQRRLVISVCILVTAGSIALLLLLLSVDGLQHKHLNDLSKDITSENNQLSNKKNIGKVLTVQNQLQSLTSLHDQKPAASRVFEYLNQVTPASVSITNFTIDFTAQTATITGTSDSLSNVNKYVDTLKFITYTTDDQGSQAAPAFSNVVLSNFGLNTSASDTSQAANYTITLAYDKNIFDITKKVTLTIPSATTTRSEVSQPSDLFKVAPPAAPTGGSH